MRLLQLHNPFPLNVYDVARFGCEEYFASEPLPASDSFANGQGPGLFARRFGSRDIPVAVEGSEAMRIYQLGVLTRTDGTQQLVGLGVRTTDIFASGLPIPQAWALQTPDPLMIFTSEDGETWEEYSLGAIEKADGSYPLSSYQIYDEFTPKEEDNLWNRPASIQNAFMNSTARWRSGINEWGAPCLWTCSGTHLIEWDGHDARVTPLGTRATALALSNGRFYFSAGSRSSIEANDGALALTTVDTTSMKPPLAGESRIVIVQPGTNLIQLKDKPGAIPHVLQGVAFVGGQWLVLVSRQWVERARRGETTVQEFASFYLPSLPTDPIEVPTQNLEYLNLTGAQEYFDLGRYNTISEPGKPADPIAIRRVSGRALVFQRGDFQDQGGTLQVPFMERETMPVLETLCNPSLADFDITAAIAHGEGHILGTADGYLLSARIDQNRVAALALLDGKVLRVLPSGGRFYALTAGALWTSQNGTTWEPLHEAHASHGWRDAIITGDGRLFAVSNGADSGGGPNTRVCIYDVSEVAPVLLQEDSHATRVLDVLAEAASGVLIFGTDEDGDYLSYSAENVATIETAALLGGEDVTAAAFADGVLWIGVASGKLFSVEADVWVLKATAAHPIAVVQVVNDVPLLGFSDGAGVFAAWDGDSIEEYSLNGPCASDARVFLDDGDGETPCGLTILTDAGPVWWNCAAVGEAEWFSEVRAIEAGEEWDEVLAFHLHTDGRPLVARAFVGPAEAGDDLTQYQPLEPGCRVRLIRPLTALRFAVVHDPAETHNQYEFASYRKPWSDA